MRVLMTADAVGGVWTYALDLSEALARHDISVVLATMGPRPSASQRSAVMRLENVRLVESDFRLEWMADPWRDVFSAGEWLLDLAHSAAVDVVHVNGYSHAALPFGRPVVCVAHSCVVSWWHAVHREQPPAEWDEYRRHVARGLNCADRVIAPTRAFLEQLQSCYGFEQPCQVIANGRPQNIFLKRSAPVRKGARPGLPERAVATSGEVAPEKGGYLWGVVAPEDGDGRVAAGPGSRREPLLLGCGRLWDAAKNFAVLDAAVEGLPWPAYVIGDTGQTFAPKAVRTPGALSQEDVSSWLRRASIFVHPALYEPFGLAVLEAAAAGCALVLADIPTLRELWDGAALFHNPRDSAELHDILDALIADPAKQIELAEAAQQRAAEYSADAMAAAYAIVYRQLQRSSNARAVA